MVSMSAIGAAANNRMADMMEQHPEHMKFVKAVAEEKAKADERFARRFATILEKHEKADYGQDGAST